jgi:hypothetical protein
LSDGKCGTDNPEIGRTEFVGDSGVGEKNGENNREYAGQLHGFSLISNSKSKPPGTTWTFCSVCVAFGGAGAVFG